MFDDFDTQIHVEDITNWSFQFVDPRYFYEE